MKISLKLNWKIISGCALALIPIVVAVISVSFLCWAGEASLPVPVRVSVAEPTASVSGLRYSANITPRKQVDLAFKVGGYVHEIAALPGPDGIMRDVCAGDRVTQGMILARIDVKDYAVRASQTRASLEEAKASLAMARKDYERNQSLVKSGYVAKNDFDRNRRALMLPAPEWM